MNPFIQRIAGRLSRQTWVIVGVMILALGLSRIDSPSPKVLVQPLREHPGDSDVNMKMVRVFKEKGLDYPVYDKFLFTGQMKHQNPQTAFVFYWPLAGFSPENASRILDVFYRICFLLSTVVVIVIFERVWQAVSPGGQQLWQTRRDKFVGRISLFLLIIFFFPHQIALHQMQIQMFINTVFCVMMLFELRQRQGFVSGLLMGIVTSLKPQYGLYVVWGMLRRKARFVITFLSVLAVVGLTTIAMFGIDNTMTFFLRVLPDLSKRGEAYFPNQSINGILNRLTTTDMNAHFSYTQYPPEQPLVVWGTRLGLLALIGFALLSRKGPRNDGVARALDLGFVGLAFTMAGTIAWEHYYGILVPILAVLIPLIVFETNRPSWKIPVLVIAYLLTGLRWWQAVVFADRGFLTLFQSALFFGSLLILILLFVQRRALNSQPATS